MFMMIDQLPVLAEAGVSLSLGGVLDVGVVEKILNAQQDLLDGNCGPPVFLLVQDRQADCSRWVDIGVEERGHELHLGGCGGEVILEYDLSLVKSSLPRSSFLAGDSIPA